MPEITDYSSQSPTGVLNVDSELVKRFLLAPDMVPAGASVAAAGFFVADVSDARVFKVENAGEADEGTNNVHAFRVAHVLDKEIDKD